MIPFTHSRQESGLSDSVIQKICGVLTRYPQVEKAVLYGSRAKGSHRKGSDIDLTLCGGADLTLSVRHTIATELDDLFLPYMIDLSIFRDIGDSDLIEHIQRVGTILYERQQQLMDGERPGRSE